MSKRPAALTQATGKAFRQTVTLERLSNKIDQDTRPNPIEAALFKPVDLHGLVSSQVVADLVAGARLVKAFNHLRAEVLVGDPDAPPTHIYLAACLAHLGQDAAAKAALAEVHRVFPDFSTTWVRTFFPYKHAPELDRLLEGLHGLST